MTARAKLTKWPDRQFLNCYFTLPGGAKVYGYLSAEPEGNMLALDLRDASDGSITQQVVTMMREERPPFHRPEEVTAGENGRFIVAQILPTD